MTYTKNTSFIQEFLASIFPFNSLSTVVIANLSEQFQPLRYRMGKKILIREKMPSQIMIIYQGQVRLLGYDPCNQQELTLGILNPGNVLGCVSLVRGIPCEAAIASSDTVCLTLAASEFLTLLKQEPQLADVFQNKCTLVEIFDLLGAELIRRADGVTNLKELALQVLPETVVCHPLVGKTSLSKDRIWLLSSGMINGSPVGSRLNPDTFNDFKIKNFKALRLIGIPQLSLEKNKITETVIPSPALPSEHFINAITPAFSEADIPDAPVEETAEFAFSRYSDHSQEKLNKYPYIRGRGFVDETLACFQMLSQYFGIRCRKDVIQRVLIERIKSNGSISLKFCGAVSELIGLKAQLISIPAEVVNRLPTPAIINWQDSFAVVYKISSKEIILAVPGEGIRQRKLNNFIDSWGQSGQVLLLSTTNNTPKERFSLRWFLPFLSRYRKVLLEVFIASFFVQLFALANPLITQVIIDLVVAQNNIDTLHVLGFFLVVVAIFEAILTSLRTYLFVDTTNRIDLALGSEIIDHLLRLPLSYFDRRSVGEVSSRINELENIRQFLTGTALTVVLDAVFSVIYIIVMAIYSWLLTLVALATVPLFILITIIASPIVRQQLRTKAENNAKTQSYLVEVVSGIRTVKAQNIELRSRWQWQNLYSRYVSAGFKSVITSTAANSTRNFLNKLSSLMVLWVGAYLVLQQQLTLGELIAFRIISGYVTSPLLRLAQLWQNFQETGLSLERLSDILDTPQEADEESYNNIPMPIIAGNVKYENISFRFAQSGQLQLSNINLEISEGMFVGIVGQSGSGKSTLTKLLARLYEPISGRIIIDDYDISKVELSSLRQQIGVVPQDTLLFDETIQENIAINYPEATFDQIINAAKIAVAHDFIMSLPNGYNTRVGERGSTLSGGQKQRIAIARTVLQNPRLLILDEATSALDYDSERQVCLNLAEAFKERTVFFITHRLSTIKNSDLILMMEQGVIVERGTHNQLMDLKGRYYCLYRQQEAQV
ncbi:peptidase domain-containing ABC transporter [Nodularia sp. UHCC 0506]|uniref:peptidase domain-containing ABC transporter n=1 Tax=Nodularia sp. UHCC 0506 TaxID=3110243 RepID=UPI002B1EE1E1|nr:peptidase domain-containing ABC transporter [Nodularia sp. UHCC 0506]MEA5517089.1 peptidase domain-containing ABC transporter [Nodularia sp. UHCC 0506]